MEDGHEANGRSGVGLKRVGRRSRGRSKNREEIMRLLVSLTAPTLLVLGFAGIAQAGTNGGGGVPCETTEYAILECKTDRSGDIVVVAFTDGAANHAPSGIDKGDDCTQALESLFRNGDNHGHSYTIEAITTGSTDRTVYTTSVSNFDECPQPP
jgi:hypothetical protein